MYLDCKQTAEMLSRWDNFLLVTHKNPDGDSLCSAAALCSALRRAGKTAYMFANPGVSEKFEPFVSAFLAPAGFARDCTVCVDVAAEDMFCKGFSGSVDLAIDHHPTNPGFGAENCIYPEASACGEIVLEIIEQLCGGPDRAEATLLYIALTTDTGAFMYSNVNPGSFAAASRLLSYGAEYMKVNRVFFREVSRERIALEGMIYSGFEYYRGGEVVVSVITLEMMEKSGAGEKDIGDLAGLPGRVKGQEVTVLIRELEKGKCKISVRSGRNVSSSRICSYFGGGGHEKASGCTIEAEPERAKKLLLEVIDSVLDE